MTVRVASGFSVSWLFTSFILSSQITNDVNPSLTSPAGVVGISDIAPESGKVQKVMQDLKCS